MFARSLPLIACALLGAGCATTRARPPGELIGVTRTAELDAQAPPPKEPELAAPLPEDIVERSALPYHGVRTRDSAQLTPADLGLELSRADVICVGEEHPNPHHHWAQLRLLTDLASRARMAGRQLGVGFEMFARPAQPALDRYYRGKLGEQGLLEEVDWDTSWGFDFSLYRPLLEASRARNMPIVALNAPRELTRAVAHEGIEGLNDDQTRALPELDLGDREHRRLFGQAMESHPPSPGGFRNMYAAQVVWDETMAETAAAFVNDRLPARQLVVFAGVGHCHRSAIPERIERRADAAVVSVRPLVVSTGETPALTGYDYAFVMTGS